MFLAIFMTTYIVCIYYVFVLHEKYINNGSVNSGFSRLYCYMILLSCMFVPFFGRLNLEQHYPYETYAVCSVYLIVFCYFVFKNKQYEERYGKGNRYFNDFSNS